MDDRAIAAKNGYCYECDKTCLCHTYAPHILKLCCLQVRAAETELRHKLFPPNAWMKILNFDVLTSCPKDELHQWFIGLYGEHIVPAIVYRYTQALQRPDLVTLDKNGEKHALVSNEAVARVFKRLADRLQGVVSDTSSITITPEYAAHFLEVFVKKLREQSILVIEFDSSCCLFHSRCATSSPRRYILHNFIYH